MWVKPNAACPRSFLASCGQPCSGGQLALLDAAFWTGRPALLSLTGDSIRHHRRQLDHSKNSMIIAWKHEVLRTFNQANLKNVAEQCGCTSGERLSSEIRLLLTSWVLN